MAPDDQATAAPQQLFAFTPWWGEESDQMETMLNGSLKASYRTMLETQKVMGEVLNREFEAMNVVQDGFNKSFGALLACRRPEDVPAAYAKLAVAYFKAVETQAAVGMACASRLRQAYGNFTETRS